MSEDKYEKPKELDIETSDSDLIKIYKTYKAEAMQARHDRIQQNRLNFDCYHLRQDFSYKQKGQSQEFLPKMAMAVEQIASSLQQGLTDLGDWFRVGTQPGLVEDLMKIKPYEIERLMKRQLELNDFYRKVGDGSKLGLIGSLMIAKIGGQWVPKPKYKVQTYLQPDGSYKKKLLKQEDKVWRLNVDLVRQQDFFPDPTGRNMYICQDIYMDYYQAEQLAKGPNKIYDLKALKQLKSEPASEGAERYYNKARETGQNISNGRYRSVVKITEIWGNFVDTNGDLLFENCVMTVGNDRVILQPPTPNPYWHGKIPFVYTPIISVPMGVWGKALMDAPVMLNKAQNEMFNLILDGGMMSVHGIKQLREHWLEDPGQVEGGIGAGDTLRVNSACPPGMTALERVDTATVPQDGIEVYNLLNQEFNVAALTNDLRMGVQPFRAVKATEVVESSQANASMSNGLAKHIEQNFITPILDLGWKTAAQHMNDLDSNEVKSLLGPKRAEAIANLGPEELFADTVQGCQFTVFGISATLNKQKEFTKLQAMLQTVAGSPVLMEEFAKEFDFGKLLGEIMKSLDIHPDKIKADDVLQNGGAKPEVPPPPGGPQGPGQAPGEMPNVQSQIPQAASQASQAGESPEAAAQPGPPQQPITAPKFPASRATPRQ